MDLFSGLLNKLAGLSIDKHVEVTAKGFGISVMVFREATSVDDLVRQHEIL
jgi:hypothetical protein